MEERIERLERLVAEQAEALRQRDHQLRSVLDNLASLVGYWDLNLRNGFGNHAYQEWFGIDPASIRGMHVREVIGEEAYQQNLPYIEGALAGQRQQFERTIPAPDGSHVRHALVDYIPDIQDGVVQGFLAQITDVTPLKTAEAALRDSEERFSTVFHCSPIGIGLGRINGELLDVNQAWLDVVGYDRDEVIGRTIADLGIYERPEHRLEVIAALQASGKVTNLEIPYRRKNGERIEVEYSAEIVTLSDIPYLMVMITDITRRKEEAIALRRFGTIVEHLGDPVVFIDRDERFVTANRAYAAMIARNAADLVGQRFEDVIGPEPYSVASPYIKAVLAGEPQHYPLDRIFPDGQRHVFDIRLVPFLHDGEVQGLVANMHDITELREIQSHLETAQAMAGMGSWIMDIPSGVYRTTYFAFTNLGWMAKTFTEEMVQSIIHSDDFVLRQTAWEAALAGAPYDIEHRYVIDGRVIWVHVKANIEFDAEGRPVKAIGVTQDITATRQAQEDLRAYKDRLEDLVAARTMELASAEAQMRLIVESSGDGLFGIDTEGVVTFINPAACALLGYRPEEVLGFNYHQRFHFARADGSAYPEADCPIKSALRTGEAARRDDEVFWHANGGAVPVSYSAHPMSRDGIVVGAVVSFADITERKRTERARESALAEAERLARVRREFLANMSHEIRTPLNAVLGLAQIGRSESDGRRTSTIFGNILESGKTLLAVVDDILDFSKIEAGKFTLDIQPLSLGDVIDQALGLVAVRAYAKGLDLQVEEASDLPEACLGDAQRLTQVLGNLLSNAVKFTKARGRVGLSISREDTQLVFRVSDSGIGMNADQMARLFHPFEQADGSTTRNFGGTGLGLAITKNLVELMGGSIAADSRPDAGSRFTVRLPLKAVEETRPASRPMCIAVTGLPEAEAAPLLAALIRRGVCALPLAPGEKAPSSADLVVTTAEAAASIADRAVIEAAVARGQMVVLVVTPGSNDVPIGLSDRVRVVERPLRARHLLSAPLAAVALGPLAPMPGLPRLVGCRILAAEDNEVNRLVLEEILTLEGAILDCVENGRLAIDCLGRRGYEAYDIVITDIQMPEMDGYELARRIRMLDPTLPVIGLTAHAMPEERGRCLAAGMVEHAAKPINIDHLVSVVLVHRRVAHHPMLDRKLLEARYGNRPAFIAKLFATIKIAHGGSPAELREAVRAGDLARLVMLAHTLKGAAGNMAAPALQDIAQRTEAAVRAGKEEATALATELAAAVETLLGEIAE